ncbi:ATP-dependent RNA helicase RhlE, partial [Sphingomonas sp. LH128]
RGGQPRRDGQRDGARSDRPQGERREGGEAEGERKRRFRPRGPKGLGAHKGAVKRAG